MASNPWAIGIDVGATKIEAARVDSSGLISHRRRRLTQVQGGSSVVIPEIVRMVRAVVDEAGSAPLGIGVGIAGQIQPVTGIVRSSPNLAWREVPLQSALVKDLSLPVFVVNDVCAATWGEWLSGAGTGCNDLVCVFVGTGIGGGVVSGGKLLTGVSGTAGEVGHMTVDLHGSPCHCGNQGCLETIAGGWGIAERARKRVSKDPARGAELLAKAKGELSAITARYVAEAAGAGDFLATDLIEEAKEALVAGMTSIVNAFNPTRLILGGGIIEGIPKLIKEIESGVRARALKTALEPLSVYAAQLHGDAGVVGAASMALRMLAEKERSHDELPWTPHIGHAAR